jgi:hypothetical protein
MYYLAFGLTCSNETGSYLSNYAKIAGEYTAEETLPDGVTADDLLNSTTYVAAKQTGLATALNVSVPDVTITGFTITPHHGRRPAAVGRQLVSHVSVTTSFTVNIAGSNSADSLSASIANASTAIEAETNNAMAAADWSGEPVLTAAPTMAAPTMGAAASTAQVTDAPTPVPVIIGASMGGVAATGDPHLQNIYGERFDLVQAGRHVLVHIPMGASSEGTLLRVEAEAQRLGEQCADMYFQELNLTGRWAEAVQAGGLRFRAKEAVAKDPKWIKFGRVDVKVAHGHTQQGTRYLNVYVKHLNRAGFAVGGLLGEDDHRHEATPPADCVHHRLSI